MEYRIEPIQVQPHGLKEPDAKDVLGAPIGYELFRREGIRLISMGIYDTQEKAREAATRHAGKLKPLFL